jgi:hypothetical protein
MEFFVPGLTIFLLTIIFTIFVAPKATPMIAAILALVFVTYGVYDHYRLFQNEYRLSTWQNTFKIYLPYIMVSSIIIYAIFSMLAFFTGGAVPIPSMPAVEAPSMESVTNSLNTAVNSIANTTNDLLKSANQSTNSLLNSLENSLGLNNSGLNKSSLSKSGNNNGMSRSVFETL